MQSGYLAARLRRSAAIGIVFAATCAPAFAQNDSQPPAQTVDVVQPAEETEEGDRVVVTGSRIARSAFTSTAPIQVITSEAATLEGLVDTAELLQGSSIAQGSTQINNSFGNFIVEGGLGANSVSLRGLGAQRSLVLLNGQRPGPAGTRGQVGAFDLNVIPNSIIERAEILKDGASSVYGSDAVAGVVNIITRSSIESPELNIQYNATEEGGGNTLSVNGALGFELLGGNILLAAEYEDRDPLKFGDRRHLACAQDLAYDRATGRRIDRQDRSILGNTSLGGCSTGNIYFNTVQDFFANDDIRYIPSPNGATIGPFPGYRPRANGAYDDFPGRLPITKTSSTRRNSTRATPSPASSAPASTARPRSHFSTASTGRPSCWERVRRSSTRRGGSSSLSSEAICSTTYRARSRRPLA